MSQLALLAAAFVVVEAIVFAIVSIIAESVIAYPTVVALWVAFLWIFSARALRTFSASPHSLRRAVSIILVASAVSIAALVLSVAIGVLLIG